MLWSATIRHDGDLGLVDWRGAMRSKGPGVLELPARNEASCRARVRLLTERAFRFPMEPMFVVAGSVTSKNWWQRYRRELPSRYGYLVTAWLVTPYKNRDESRAIVWEAMDVGTAIRVASVKDGRDGYCVVEVGVMAKCGEQAEVMVRELLQEACVLHELVFTPIMPHEDELWIEQREHVDFGVDNGAKMG